uniref:NADH-ubiquinone oxidoreductase chain 2 n=1 Tax=Haemaphysalis formosensis TaxID=1155004 RepID=L7PCT9_HAEFO|nr:NADH dehydrogenase subunit 2 [Haemaphysalis formosensis]AFU55277.1 NADH dehydrogenase subunit 2 [Haemaphysalis formosensis]UXX50198.1 NADH dehydrogenase subunit 2 [Haemaphysalis formosensis]
MFFKNLMTWMIMITIMISISSNHWFIYWIMMEMNMMMFIPILKYNKLENCNSMITYFVIQSFSSILFFMASSMMMINYSFFMEMLINISMMIKLAMIPFHSWLISISETLDYNSFLIILTFQKIIPLFILSKMKMEISMIISILSLMMSSIMIFNLKILKKILIFSSISHLSWMIMIMFMSSNFWISYMIIYFMMINSILKILKINKISSVNSMMSMKISNNEKIKFVISMLSLGGMPPFVGFLIKFIAILLIIKYSLILMSILIISSLINIFIYIRMIMPMLLTFNKMEINFNMFKYNKNLYVNTLIIFTLFLMNMMF